MGKSKHYSAKLKAKVALEAIKEQKTRSQIASGYEIHPSRVSEWKNQALLNFEELFKSKTSRNEKEKEKLIDRLYQQIGQLKVELDWLKKKSDMFS